MGRDRDRNFPRIPALWVLLVVALIGAVGCAGSRAEKANRRGVDLSRAGKYTEAIREYGEAVRLDPRLAKAYFNMGLDYVSLKQPDQAAACFQRALEIDPSYTKASEELTRINRYLEARRLP